MAPASEKEVEKFLERFRKEAYQSGIDFIDREGLLEGLGELNLTIALAEEIILDLTVRDYEKGPEPNKTPGFKGTVWMFGVPEGNGSIYIKLALDVRPRCLSFHPAKYRQSFPYRK